MNEVNNEESIVKDLQVKGASDIAKVFSSGLSLQEIEREISLIVSNNIKAVVRQNTVEQRIDVKSIELIEPKTAIEEVTGAIIDGQGSMLLSTKSSIGGKEFDNYVFNKGNIKSDIIKHCRDRCILENIDFRKNSGVLDDRRPQLFPRWLLHETTLSLMSRALMDMAIRNMENDLKLWTKNSRDAIESINKSVA